MINDFVVRGTNGLKTTHMCHDAIFCEKRHNLSQYSFFEIATIIKINTHLLTKNMCILNLPVKKLVYFKPSHVKNQLS